MLKRNNILSVFMAVMMLIATGIQVYAAVRDTGYAEAWYADGVMYCDENGLMSGTGEKEFSTEIFMSRAMLVTVLYNAEGNPGVTAANLFLDTVMMMHGTETPLYGALNEKLSLVTAMDVLVLTIL